MKTFFEGVRKHIGKLNAERLREQYDLMAEELARCETLVHASKEGILRLDADGAVLWTNPAARALLGSDPASVLPGLDIPIGTVSKREFVIAYPESRILEMRTVPSGNETLVFLHDITAERERSDEELRAGATKAVQDLAAGIAHEIGNPLNAIALNLQLVKRDPNDTEAIDLCMGQVKRLDGILRDFLSALRPQRPNLTPGSPVPPLQDCLSELKEQIVQRRFQVTVNIPNTLPIVALDANQMKQVFFNLLKNAFEAMPDGALLLITVQADDENVLIAFRDSGLGMDEEQVARLFEPYRTTKEKGTGLGLMISRRIVHDHGGSIAVLSKKGEGTTFTVKLPRIEKRIRVLK